ncbi:MAG TPA: hypothetical protein VFX59_08700 [Polyangiales bacterium]|nr:hypothetical protein [Polyangiales bacterium]
MNSFATRFLFATCLGALGFAYACGDDAPSSDDGHEHDHDAAAEADTDDHTDEEVPCDASYPSFTPGMSVKAGDLTVKLLAVKPEPPRQKVKNDWVLQVVDASGATVSGITLANASSYMPVHRHGGRTKPTSAAGSEPATVQLNDIDFIMRGPWQVIFDVQQNGAKAATATLQICVE